MQRFQQGVARTLTCLGIVLIIGSVFFSPSQGIWADDGSGGGDQILACGGTDPESCNNTCKNCKFPNCSEAGCVNGCKQLTDPNCNSCGCNDGELKKPCRCKNG